MTANERKLIRAAEKLFEALERVARWSGTGSVQQDRAYSARDKAMDNWLKVKELILEADRRSGVVVGE